MKFTEAFRILHEALDRLREQRAAIERVRGLHQLDGIEPGIGYIPECITCEQGYPCQTIRALDGDV